ncbi:MAG: DUF4384 domain-containing protein [Pseudomonadota bacterium]
MRSGPGAWILGTGASVALHGAGAVVALALVAPEEMPEQPTPGAQFELETTALDRSRAEEQTPDSGAAAERPADGAVAQGQSIARRNAPATVPTGTAAAPVAEAAAAAAAVAPEGQLAQSQSVDSAVSQAATPNAPRAKARAPDSAAAAAVASESTAARAEAPQSAAAPAAALDSPPISAEAPETAVQAAFQPQERVATAAAPPASSLSSASPVGERAPSAEASGARAPAAAAVGTPAPSSIPTGVSTPAATVDAPVASAAPAIGAMASSAPVLAAAAPAAAPVGQIAAAAPALGAAAPSAAADAPQAAAAPATGVASPTATAEGTPAASADAPSTQAAAATIEGPVIGAELAWAGQGALDPQGLAAVQAFLPEAARSEEGEEVRDDISALMSSVPCARVHTAFNPDTGALELRGHVPTQDARPDLVGALQSRVGETLPVTDALRLLPEPQCDVLTGIEGLGLPPSEEQFTDPALVGETGWAQDYAFRGGDALKLQLRGADYPAYVYLDYYDGDGNVVHVVPNEFIDLPFLQPDEPFFVGPDEGFEIYFSPPYGQDIVVAIAAEEPLYDGLRPLVEPAETYLAYLRDRMETLGISRGEWAYFFVTTSAP